MARIGLSPLYLSRRGAVVKSVEHISTNHHLSGAGSSPAGSVSRDLNSQKLGIMVTPSWQIIYTVLKDLKDRT